MARAAGLAARKPTGDASQPWMKFHNWDEEENTSPTQPVSITSTAQPAAADDDAEASGTSNRRVFKGVQLKPAAAGNPKHGHCTALPAVNALCHARGAGDYCQLESWEVRQTSESLKGHSILTLSEQVCLGTQRSVCPSMKSRLTAKYFSKRDCSNTTSDHEYPHPTTHDYPIKRDVDSRDAKILALSQHDRTSTVEAAHAACIARKRRFTAAAFIQESDGNCSRTEPSYNTGRSIRRRLNFNADHKEAEPESMAPPGASGVGYGGVQAASETNGAMSPSSDKSGPEGFPELSSLSSNCSTPTSSLPCQHVAAVVAGVVNEIVRRADAPKLYILTDFFEDIYRSLGPSCETAENNCHTNQTQASRTGADSETPHISPKTAGRWIQALRVYHNTDLWAPTGFDNDSNFERNEVWVSMERVLLPIDQGTMFRRRTIDFSTASPPCHNYVCHSMIKPHSRYVFAEVLLLLRFALYSGTC